MSATTTATTTTTTTTTTTMTATKYYNVLISSQIRSLACSVQYERKAVKSKEVNQALKYRSSII